MRQTFRKSKLPIDRDRLRQVISAGAAAQAMLRGRHASLLIESDMGRVSPPPQPVGPDMGHSNDEHQALVARVEMARRCAIYAAEQRIRVEGQDRFLPNAGWQGF